MSSDAQTIVPASHLDLLSAPVVAHIATIGPDGAPQSSPVWFDWDGARLILGMVESRQKLRNLRRDPHVAASIVDPTNQNRYMEIRGLATFVPDPNREVLGRLMRKYTGTDNPSWLDSNERIIVAIEPTHTTQQG